MYPILKRILKIIGVVFLAVLVVLIVLFYRFSSPKSDAKIKKKFAENTTEVFINHTKYKEFKYRFLATQKEIDTTISTIIFIHGSIGSGLDFKNYLSDNELNKKFNLVSYDRVGYGIHQTGEVQESIKFETELLEDLITKLNTKKVILVGYSYGGPIALASNKNYEKIVLLAPAVYSKVEPIPWGVKLYQWSFTKWLLPPIWKAASKEKLSHKKDLQFFEQQWFKNTSKVVSIHGSEDWIVPFENSVYLKENFSPQQFELVTLTDAGHGLVWSHFSEIKQVLLQPLN